MDMISDEKYDAFKEFYNDRDTLLDSTDFLIPVFKTLTDGLFNEIDSNKYKFQDQGRFNEYKSERLEFMFKSLSEIVEGLRPRITDIPIDLNFDKIKKDGTGYKPRIKTLQQMGYPLRQVFLQAGKSSNDATKQLHEEVDFIDSLIKKIEMKKSESKNPTPKEPSHSLTKLKWKGDQKQLAELFIRLEKLDWIEPIQDGQRQSICRNICNLFDISHTKKKENSNEVNSFTEIMKADTDKKTKVKTYSKVFTQRYKERFSAIDKRENK